MNENIKAGADINAGDGGYKLGTPEEYDAFVKGRNQSLAMMRIREFARVSRLDVYGLGAKRIPWEAALEKYAELIVRECARVYWNIDDGEIHGEYVKALKEHFGIEK